MKDAIRTFRASPFHINNDSYLSVSEIREKTLLLAGEKGLDLVVIDSMQDIAKPTKLKNERTPSLPESLKSLAEELKAPVLLIDGLTREIERRTDLTPRLSDLLGGHLVTDIADVVLFIRREFYYLRDERARVEIVDVLISKNRNGPVNKQSLQYEVRTGRFENADRQRVNGAISL
jgi:replicative DNA helicase